MKEPTQCYDQKPPQKKSLRGCLRQYANPALIATEAKAWLETVTDIDHLALKELELNGDK
jgi:hypothetical protein